MTRFVVLVEWLRSDGGFEGLANRGVRDFSEVAVLADTESEAHLIACEMVMCRPGINPTRTLRSC